MNHPSKFRLFFLGNLFYKALALVLALIIWYVVQGEEILEVNSKLDVRIEVGEGYALRDPSQVARDITLRGPRVLVGRLQSKALQAIIRIPPGKTGNLRYRLDKEFIPQWDQRIRLTIHDPYVSVTVEEKATKRLSIKPILVGDVSAGMMVEGFTVTPTEIDISGPKTDVNRISEITTEPIDISGLSATKTFVTQISRANIPDVNFSSKDVSLTLNVSRKRVQKTFAVIPIEILGTDKVSSARPAAVSVSARIAEEFVANISQKDFHATADVNGLLPGRHDVPVTVAAPDGVEVSEVTPKLVSIEIYNQRKLKAP